jgi:hypothetical protein
MVDDLRYPIGPEPAASPLTDTSRRAAIDEIASLPGNLRAAVANLTASQIDTPYRPDGWTIRQVVHHVADSHMHSVIRLKTALAEDTPTIKPYDERVWATLADYRLPIEISLTLVEALHARWVALYGPLDEVGFKRAFFHPERGEQISVERHLQIYAWHSRHHVAHIVSLRQRQGW